MDKYTYIVFHIIWLYKNVYDNISISTSVSVDQIFFLSYIFRQDIEICFVT